MHNPTRRMKRFRSATKPSNQLPETDITRSIGYVDESPISSSNHVRHQPQLDALRGAMLIALVVVTIILYLVLWELERSSFTPVPKPNWGPNAIVTSLPSLTSKTFPPPATRWQERLAQESNLTDDRIAASSSHGMTRFAWSPFVTRVPEEHGIQALAEEQTSDRTHKDEISEPSPFDSTYCNGTCRFFFPVRVGEQESKARVHFTQLQKLARRLNRTLVLPNVGNSRMGACSEWPFDAYYDTNGLAHGSDAPELRPAIDLEEFVKWVHERPEPPNSFLVSLKPLHQDRRDLLRAPGDSDDVPFIVQRAEVEPKIASCLESKLARLRPFFSEMALSITFDPGRLRADSEHASNRLVQLLSTGLDLDANSDFDLVMEPQYPNSSYLLFADIDVLVLNYDLRYPLFPASADAHFNLHYTPVLYDLADRLSDNLGPFLGVHWRMENVPLQNLAWCAASLVSTLHALLQDDNTGERVRHVWLATDYPRSLGSFVDEVRFPAGNGLTSNGIAGGSGLDADGSSLSSYGPLRKSSTFKALSLEHDDAIGILTEAFRPGGDLDAWKLTDLAEQLHRYPYVEGRLEVNETLLNDSGVFGILDKLVIVQAWVFVSGSESCSKTSSFSKQVIEARQETFEAEQGKGAIRNVVEHFGGW